MEQVDVIVVGAGPVGLLTAIELTLAGASVLILERLAAPSDVFKALAVGPLGAEALERRGMAAEVDAEEKKNFEKMAQGGGAPRGPGSRFNGHFGGLSLIRKDAQKEPHRRSRAVDQQGLEAMLARRAEAAGIQVRRSCEVLGFAEQPDGIHVSWTSPAGDHKTHCSYLVGCDGGRSSVRKMAGFDFPGSPPTMTMYNAVVEIDHPERLLPPGWHRTSGGVFLFGFLPGRLVMMDFSGPPSDREAPVTREEVEAVLRRVSCQDVRVESLESGSRWTDNTRLVDTYRRGRVVLAGDAAHIHSPFGGQGLSLGLGDAANLGWKLAAVARGEMPESLLDTYTAERRPVAEAVLSNTLAQASIMRPDAQSGAMRDLIARLLEFDDVNGLFGEMMSGLSTRYDLGSDQDGVGRLLDNRHVGRGDSEGALYDLMLDGAGVLLDASTAGQASQCAAGFTSGIRCVIADDQPSMLIRPDGCVAWIGEGKGTDGLVEALRRWFVPNAARVTNERSAPAPPREVALHSGD